MARRKESSMAATMWSFSGGKAQTKLELRGYPRTKHRDSHTQERYVIVAVTRSGFDLNLDLAFADAERLHRELGEAIEKARGDVTCPPEGCSICKSWRSAP